MQKDKTQRISGSEKQALPKLSKGAELFQASIEHNGESNETKVVVAKFLFQYYERGKNLTEVEIDEDDSVPIAVVDERFPHVPIKHQSTESFFATPEEAVLSLYSGVARAESVLAKYIVDNYSVEIRDAVYQSVSAFED